MSDPTVRSDSPAWRVQVWLAFLASVAATFAGIVFLPADLWVRGYLLMGLLFVVGSTLSLAKTLRDHHESKSLDKRMSAARTHRILKEFELDEANGRA